MSIVHSTEFSVDVTADTSMYAHQEAIRLVKGEADRLGAVSFTDLKLVHLVHEKHDGVWLKVFRLTSTLSFSLPETSSDSGVGPLLDLIEREVIRLELCSNRPGTVRTSADLIRRNVRDMRAMVGA